MTNRVRLWTTSMAAAALVALPLAAAAQTYPPAGQTSSGQANPSSQYGSTDQNSPQFHLDEAKRVLDSISTADLSGAAMSQVSQIKTQFSDLYNDYAKKSGSSGAAGTSGMTPPPSSSTSSGGSTDWKTQFNTIENELDGLNIPKSSYAPSSTSGTGGTAGTSGGSGMTSGSSTAGSVNLPSEVRDSLEQFRTHLEQFNSLVNPQR